MARLESRLYDHSYDRYIIPFHIVKLKDCWQFVCHVDLYVNIGKFHRGIHVNYFGELHKYDLENMTYNEIIRSSTFKREVVQGLSDLVRAYNDYENEANRDWRRPSIEYTIRYDTVSDEDEPNDYLIVTVYEHNADRREYW